MGNQDKVSLNHLGRILIKQGKSLPENVLFRLNSFFLKIKIVIKRSKVKVNLKKYKENEPWLKI